MLTLKSSILLSAVVIALMSTSSLTSKAEDTPAKPAIASSEAAAEKPAEKPAVKPAPAKPLHQRVGAGEIGASHNKVKPDTSWIKVNPPKEEAKTSDKLAQSQAAAKKRSEASKHHNYVPKWKQKALDAKKANAAKKAEAEKMAEADKKPVVPSIAIQHPDMDLKEKAMPRLKVKHAPDKVTTEHAPKNLEDAKKPMPALTMREEEKVEHAPVKLAMPPLKVDQGPEKVEHAPVKLAMPPLKVEQGPEKVEHAPVKLAMPPLKIEQGPTVVEEHTTTTLTMPPKHTPQASDDKAKAEAALEKEEMKKNPALEKNMTMAERLQQQRAKVMKEPVAAPPAA